MCGRYTLTNQQELISDLDVTLDRVTGSGGEWARPRFNVSPTQPAPVVRREGDVRAADWMRWGLLPFWSTAPGARPPLMINARVESVLARPVFRELLARKRCLVPADGFFEWTQSKTKTKSKPAPTYFHPEPRRVFAFAGLWSRARTDSGAELYSFTILTGPPNELVKSVHDRMPIVLAREAWEAWLDPATDAEAARALLEIPVASGWIAERVSTRVNSPKNDDAACIEGIAADGPDAPEPPAQGSLF